jgi:hypothetical protein
MSYPHLPDPLPSLHRFHLSKIKVLGFIRLILASHICFTDSIPWVHTREEGSLDYDGGFVCLQVHFKFNTNIYRQHAHSKYIILIDGFRGGR